MTILTVNMTLVIVMKIWPTDYQNWEGGFEELVSAAAEVIRHQDPTAKPLTGRLVRHYIQTGVVGRGQRDGRQSRFGYQELSSLVAAKHLVKDGWTLDNAKSLMTSAPQGYVGALSQASAPAATTPLAVDVVRELMAKASPTPMVSPRASHALRSYSPSLAAVAPPAVSTTSGYLPAGAPTGFPVQNYYSTRTLRHETFAPWLSVQLDEATLSLATSQERQDAIDALIAWLGQHR